MQLDYELVLELTLVVAFQLQVLAQGLWTNPFAMVSNEKFGIQLGS